MSRRVAVVDWDGTDVPAELRELPPGRYVVEAVDDATLTDGEDRGVEQALDQYRRGQTFDCAQARQIFDSLLD